MSRTILLAALCTSVKATCTTLGTPIRAWYTTQSYYATAETEKSTQYDLTILRLHPVNDDDALSNVSSKKTDLTRGCAAIPLITGPVRMRLGVTNFNKKCNSCHCTRIGYSAINLLVGYGKVVSVYSHLTHRLQKC